MSSRVLHLRPGQGAEGRQWRRVLDRPSLRRLEEFCTLTSPGWSLGADGLEIDLTGTDRLHGPGLDGAAAVAGAARREFPFPAAGLAGSALGARLASALSLVLGGGILAVPPANLAGFLARFPVQVLSVSGGVRRRLAELGVHTVGDLQVVPADLLQAVFGAEGRRLGLEAHGRTPGPVSAGSADGPGAVLVAGARLARPLSDPNHQGALLGGLGRRALSAVPDPGGRRWVLAARWTSGRRDRAAGVGPAGCGLRLWLGFVRSLWLRLPRARAGLVGLDLLLPGGPPGAGGPAQGILFPGETGEVRLAEAVGSSGRCHGAGALNFASEDLLRDYGVRWIGPD